MNDMGTRRKQGGIYRITHAETGRFYIGSTQDLAGRWKEHLYLLRLGKHFNRKLQSAWNKHGEAGFVYSVVEVVAEPSELLAREQFHLDTHKPHYNIALSASSPMKGRKMPPEFSQQLSERFKGRVFSPEHQAKIVAANAGFRHSESTKQKIKVIRTGTKLKPETRQKLSERNKGRVISTEHRSKISETLKGHPVTEETRQKLREAAAKRRKEKGLPVPPVKMSREEAQTKFLEAAKNKSPEHLEKMRQGLIRAWKRRKEQQNVERNSG